MFWQQPGTTECEPAELPLPALERRICDLAADINAATCRWLGLVAEFDRRGGHEEAGFASCTAWLAWRCSLTPRAAREQLRVARRLEGLPRIRAAFAEGRLSYSKVRALSRVAAPEIEAELLLIAEDATAAQLERVLAGLGGALDEIERGRLRRHLRTAWEQDGMLRVSGVLPAEEGELLLRALDAARDGLREGEDVAGPEASGGAGREHPDTADALVCLAETLLATGPQAAAGGERNQVIVRVDAGSLGRGGQAATAAAGIARVGSGGRIGSEDARRIACDASIVTLVERDGEPLSVGRRTRSIPPAIARALRARDSGCRFPGCTRTRWVDAHHVEHWADGGETTVDNLVLLCRHHHRLIHERGFRVARERGEFVFRRPGGRRIEMAPRLPLGGPLPRAPGPAPAPSGDRLDLDNAVFALAAAAERQHGDERAPSMPSAASP
jgi:hypothetical protein